MVDYSALLCSTTDPREARIYKGVRYDYDIQFMRDIQEFIMVQYKNSYVKLSVE